MATFKINTSGNEPKMEQMTEEKLSKRKRQPKSVSVKLSKNVLNEMKKVAGIRNQVSDSAILYAYITKTLQDA